MAVGNICVGAFARKDYLSWYRSRSIFQLAMICLDLEPAPDSILFCFEHCVVRRNYQHGEESSCELRMKQMCN